MDKQIEYIKVELGGFELRPDHFLKARMRVETNEGILSVERVMPRDDFESHFSRFMDLIKNEIIERVKKSSYPVPV